MVSLDHEEIINDCCVAINHMDRSDIGIMIDSHIARIIFPMGKRPPIADFYLHLPDEASLILGEVGNMRDGKWKGWTMNGHPLRILRVGFDRRISLINPTYSEVEVSVMNALNASLRDKVYYQE